MEADRKISEQIRCFFFVVMLSFTGLVHMMFLSKGHAQKILGFTARSPLDKVGGCVIYDMVPYYGTYYVTYSGLCPLFLPEMGWLTSG